ncbi:MAG: hypothetical protein LBL13_02165 [Bacteroidales bacterium]|nr:hypothetical protein [Bacteroidales bacterium]
MCVTLSKRSAAWGQNVLDCFVPRNDGLVIVVVIYSPVIANVVKQSRRKTLTKSPVLDCFVPRNDGLKNSTVLDCFAPRNDGLVIVVVIHSPVIANVVKQSRRKTLTKSPVLDCFVPRNDGLKNSPVPDCFVPRNDGLVIVVVIHSPVIANAVKQSRRKTLTNTPVYLSFSTPNGVKLFRSSDREDVFLPRAALRLHGVTYIECLPAFLKLMALGVSLRC